MARTTKDPKSKQMPLLLTEAEYARLQEISETFDMSKAQVMREALQFYSDFLEDEGVKSIKMARITAFLQQSKDTLNQG